MGSLTYSVSKAAGKSHFISKHLFGYKASSNERTAVQLAKLLAGRLHPYVVSRPHKPNKNMN